MTANDDLLAHIVPWLDALNAHFDAEGAGAAVRQQAILQLRAQTRSFAAKAQHAGLRGLANVTMLLARGLEERKDLLDETDIGQLTLWLSGVQSYLDAELDELSCLIDDLQALEWIPKLAPAAVLTLVQRLQEAVPPLRALAESRIQTLAVPAVAVQTTAEPGAEAASLEPLAPAATFTPAINTAPDAPAGAAESSTEDSSATPSDAAQAIWIATEEFQLVTETVQSRLLPVLSDLAQCDPAALAELYAEAQYQIELLGNAFGVLGLPQSQSMCVELSELLQQPGAELPERIHERTPALMQWVVLLVDLCERSQAPEARSELIDFVGSGDWLCPRTSERNSALAAEWNAVTIGLDPTLRAARRTEFTEADTTLSPAPDVLPNVLQGMLLELPENAHQLSSQIELYVKSGDPEAIDQARRVSHTLKGDANTVGISGIANLTHSLEDIFIGLAKSPARPSRAFGNLLTEAADCVAAMADHVLGRGEPPSDALSVMQQVLDVANHLAEGNPLEALEIADVAADTRLAQDTDRSHPASTGNKTPSAVVPAAEIPMLQVPADVLDRLLDFSSEALVLLRQIETQIKQVDEGQLEIERQRQEGAALLSELDKSVNLRSIALQSVRRSGEEVDPLELDQYNELYTVTRRLMEVSADESTSRNVIERAARRLLDLSAEQEKVQLELQDQIMRVRQVPVKEFVGRFQRAVRQTSKMLDKEVDFIVEGQDTLIDRVQMENLIDPLMHALRNCVDHGIEAQSLRMTRGKPINGKINLRFARDGRAVNVNLTDDGAGLNFERIRAKAVQRGFISETDQLGPDDLAQVILLPGFSTKDEVTQVSGRGIGLDVVSQRIQDLRGSLAIRSKAGAGTAVDIRLPASMSSLYCAIAPISGGGWAAIASDTVENFLLIEPEMCVLTEDQVYVHVESERIPMFDLEALITGARTKVQLPAQNGMGILVRSASGTPQIGYIREIREMRTVIVKDFGPYLRAFDGVRGGTILGDGSVAPVIDARQLMRNTSYQPWSARDETYREAVARVVKLRALVADDSLSVRRALEQLLQDNGIETMGARDGLEALALIKSSKPDILLLDLEMPRMNGLEVSAYVRKDPDLAHLPILMITSRTSDKHVQMAKDAGVDEVLSKPYSEDVLMNLVRSYLASTIPTAA